MPPLLPPAANERLKCSPVLVCGMTGEITAVEIVETDFGEKYALDSPFEAKEHIKFLPWGEDQGPNYDELGDDTPTPEFEFSDGYAAHHTWEPAALDGAGAWLVDVDSFDETKAFLESVGYTVLDQT